MNPIDLVVIWTIGYLLSFLVFVLFRRHLLNKAATNSDSTPSSSHAVPASRDGAEAATDEVADGQCPSCGTANDAFFTYCKNCLTQLDQQSPNSLSLP